MTAFSKVKMAALGPDSQGKGEDGDGGESGCLTELAQCEAQVLDECREHGSPLRANQASRLRSNLSVS